MQMRQKLLIEKLLIDRPSTKNTDNPVEKTHYESEPRNNTNLTKKKTSTAVKKKKLKPTVKPAQT